MPFDRVLLRFIGADAPGRAELRERARRRGFRRFVLEPGDPPGSEEDYVLEGDALRSVAPSSTPQMRLVRVTGPEDLARVAQILRGGGSVAVRWEGERVIPLESLVADERATGHLWVVASRPEEAPAALGALEHGADAVLVELHSTTELERLEGLLEPLPVQVLTWVEAPVHAVAPAGLGDRVIVDTTSLLAPEEGLLVGSAAEHLLHLRSEAEGSRYTRSRPFRVNAGAAHSYVLLASGETRYLAELAPGEAVLVARPGGPGRAVRVGRLKIERRPLVMIEWRLAGRARTLFVQEAETVRLSTPSGDAVAATAIGPGAHLLGVRLPAGRHLGRAVEETVEER